MRTKFAGIAAAIGFFLATGTAIAHHSFAAEFDANRAVNLKGVVTKIEWMNPHTHFTLDVKDVKDARGRVKRWVCETNSPGSLARRGLPCSCSGAM